VGGVRIGWIACQDSQLLDRAVAIRRTLSVCSGTTDEWLATLVLEHSQTLRDAARTRLIANCRLIASSAEQLGERFLWTAPQAGCAAFPLLKDDSSSLAETIIEDTGIMLIPSQCFWLGDSQGFTNGVRLGYGLSDFTEVWPRFAAYLND
jgi:aspartate/methionine/tyrosine aminotransferase